MNLQNSRLRFLAASHVGTPHGTLRDAIVLSLSNEPLGTLDGIVVDPEERRVCYFVLGADRSEKRQYLVPMGVAQMEPSRHAVRLDIESASLTPSMECRSDLLPPFSDDDLLAAIFSPYAA